MRKAIYLAVDRHEIAEISQGGSALLGNFFPPGYALSEEEVLSLPGFRVSAEGGTHPDDLMEAKRLLTEAGYPDGFKLTYNVDQSKFSRTNSELLADQLREKLNIDVETSGCRPGYFLRPVAGWHPRPQHHRHRPYFKEPETVLAQWFFQDTLRNPHNWSHPRFAELMELQGKELDSGGPTGIFPGDGGNSQRGGEPLCSLLLDRRQRHHRLPDAEFPAALPPANHLDLGARLVGPGRGAARAGRSPHSSNGPSLLPDLDARPGCPRAPC